jgi:DNA-binding XRE family transcriptional regulator
MAMRAVAAENGEWHPSLPRSRADDIDRFVGARIRERRIMLGLTQHQLAELIGVTYQQSHKYEKGINRISAGRLFAIAQALSVEMNYFVAGMGSVAMMKATPQQRMTLDLAHSFMRIPNRAQQQALCELARTLAGTERAPVAVDDLQQHAGAAVLAGGMLRKRA